MTGTRPWLRRGVVLAAVTFALLTLLVHVNEGAPLQFLVLETTLGMLFVGAGSVAWQRRPEALTGPLLTLSGVLWFAGGYALTSLEPLSWLGWSFERYYDPVLAFLALSFPGSKLHSRSARALVGTLLLVYLVRSAIRLAFGLESDDALLNASDAVTSVLIVVIAISIAALCARRVTSASPAARPAMRPVAAAGVIASISTAYDAAELAYARLTGLPLNSLPDPWAEAFSWSLFAGVAVIPLGFLIGTLRSRLRHGAIAPLALELDRGTDPAHLERALRTALGDPSLSLLTRTAGTDEWLDSSAVVVEPPAESAGRAVTKLYREGEEIAALVHDDALREDSGLVAAAIAVLRLAVENDRLSADLRTQLQEVRASRARLVEAAQAERRRIERDLHDGAQQRLVSVALMLQEAIGEARQSTPHAPFVQRLDDTSEELKSAIDELRELARGIHPAVLTEEGLGIAVAALARRASVPVELDISLEGRLPPAVEATGFYVVAEALTNVTRHSRARTATVRLRQQDGMLQVEVADDGAGGTDVSAGTGLRGLADRLEAVAGRLEVFSPVGGGTRLVALIPCA